MDDRRRDAGDVAVPTSTIDEIVEWILGLPWVVERPYALDERIRTFAVRCEPLERRRMWLVTGLRTGCGVAVIVPAGVAEHMEAEGLTTPIAPMPPNHVLVSARVDMDSPTLDAIVLDAYSCALG